MSMLAAESCRDTEILCDGRCVSIYSQIICDNVRNCINGADERDCLNDHPTSILHPSAEQTGLDNSDVATRIVLPTILACILLVASMLFGIKKCKQWELDRISDMRRTRRIVQRLTARLREKNLRTLQKARELRKRSHEALLSSARSCGGTRSGDAATHHAPSSHPTASGNPPPIYEGDLDALFCTGSSPPPAYEDALLHEFFAQLLPLSTSSSSSASRSSIRGGDGMGTSGSRSSFPRSTVPRSTSTASYHGPNSGTSARPRHASIFPV